MNHSIIDYKELRALISVGTSIIQETNLETICQRVAEAVVKYSKFQRSVVSILEPDGTLRRVGFGGLTDEQITKLKQMKRSTMEEKKNIFSDKFRVGQSYYIPHDQVSLEGLKSEKEYSPNHEWHPDDFLFIPLYSIGGEIVGMVSIDDPVDGRRPTEEGLLPLEMLANQTAASIENSRNTKKLQEMLVKLREQQKVVMELSTPVIRIWERILVLPLIGTVDSSRAMQIMENILIRISETESAVVIIDITGVPIIDTLVASHLIKTVAAVKLLGADTIITGINPEVAQTLVHLGVDLKEITTKANLSKGIEAALDITGLTVTSKDS